MKLKRAVLFLTAVVICSFLIQLAVRSYWRQQAKPLSWFSGQVGQVLGSQDVVYTYIIRAMPTEIPAVTLTPSPTPTAAMSSSASAGSVTAAGAGGSGSSSVSSSYGGVTTQGFHGPDNAHAASSESSSSSSVSSAPPAADAPIIVWCGSRACNDTEICYQNTCRVKCGAGGYCSGLYYCVSGACVPRPSGGNSSYVLFPTITSLPIQQQVADTVPGSSSSRSSVSSVARTLNIPTRPTNTPYPTRTPQNATYFNSAAGSAPVIIPPTPTPIPDILRGKSSTIVIETGNTTTILKGEDVKEISIAPPPVSAAEHQTSSAAKVQSSSAKKSSDSVVVARINPLNLSFEQKTGSKFAIQQEELVVQKGRQRVTISAGGDNQSALVLKQNDVKATVTMGLSINPITNILTVNTPNGPMRVSIMPDDAVAIIKQLKIAEKDRLPNEITLMSRNNQLEYKISASKFQKLFWMIPILIPQDVYLSADTGGLMEIKRTDLYNFVTLFTF